MNREKIDYAAMLRDIREREKLARVSETAARENLEQEAFRSFLRETRAFILESIRLGVDPDVEVHETIMRILIQQRYKHHWDKFAQDMASHGLVVMPNYDQGLTVHPIGESLFAPYGAADEYE